MPRRHRVPGTDGRRALAAVVLPLPAAARQISRRRRRVPLRIIGAEKDQGRRPHRQRHPRRRQEPARPGSCGMHQAQRCRRKGPMQAATGPGMGSEVADSRGGMREDPGRRARRGRRLLPTHGGPWQDRWGRAAARTLPTRVGTGCCPSVDSSRVVGRSAFRHLDRTPCRAALHPPT